MLLLLVVLCFQVRTWFSWYIKRAEVKSTSHAGFNVFCLKEPSSVFFKTSVMYFFVKLLLSVFQTDAPDNSTFFFLSTYYRQVIVGNQIEESSSSSEQPHCDDLSSPYPDVVASQTPPSLSGETGIHGRIWAWAKTGTGLTKPATQFWSTEKTQCCDCLLNTDTTNLELVQEKKKNVFHQRTNRKNPGCVRGTPNSHFWAMPTDQHFRSTF